MEAYSGDPAQRDEAVTALQAMGSKAVPGLIRLLQIQDSAVGKLVWNNARNLPVQARKSVLQTVRPPTAGTVRTAAARSLGIIGTNASTAIPKLIYAFTDSDRAVSMAASDALARIGPAAVAQLTSAASDSNSTVRYWSIRSIGLIGPAASNAIPQLIQHLGDQNSDVSSSAASALAQLGPPAILPTLDTVAHGRGPIRQGAAKAIRFALPSRRLAVPPVLEMLQDPDPASRIEAIQTLIALGAHDSNTIAKLEQSSADPDLPVRTAALQALQALREPSMAVPHP